MIVLMCRSRSPHLCLPSHQRRPTRLFPARHLSPLPSRPLNLLPSRPLNLLPSRPLNLLPSRPLNPLPNQLLSPLRNLPTHPFPALLRTQRQLPFQRLNRLSRHGQPTRPLPAPLRYHQLPLIRHLNRLSLRNQPTRPFPAILPSLFRLYQPQSHRLSRCLQVTLGFTEQSGVARSMM